ncbi:MAG: hypothetical protein HKN43_12125 [Rhodothermales bacterium]|nr:hypothetical protein [Rhodothermales bacterium]
MAHQPDGLAQLKKRVASAAHEIDRLKSDNQRMSDTIDDVWGDRKRKGDSLAIVVDSDRDALRGQLEGYIATIDRFLEEK